jgi:hypothetical protein
MRPNFKQDFAITFINNEVNVTSQADLDNVSISLHTDGSVWVGAAYEPITDAYVNDVGGRSFLRLIKTNNCAIGPLKKDNEFSYMNNNLGNKRYNVLYNVQEAGGV